MSLLNPFSTLESRERFSTFGCVRSCDTGSVGTLTLSTFNGHGTLRGFFRKLLYQWLNARMDRELAPVGQDMTSAVATPRGPRVARSRHTPSVCQNEPTLTVQPLLQVKTLRALAPLISEITSVVDTLSRARPPWKCQAVEPTVFYAQKHLCENPTQIFSLVVQQSRKRWLTEK